MRPYRLLTAAFIFAALVPRLVQRGIFLDGLTYASIARNLAAGRGRFWAPSYTATIYPAFFDHPPLGFWLQSLFFRGLGDHPFVERLYSVTAAAVTAFVLMRLWRRWHTDANAREHEWLPVLLWMVVPVVSWSVVSNLLETTVSLFTSLAILMLVRSADAAGTVRSFGWGTLSGACVTAAFLTKGPVGLFPMAAPVIFHFTPRLKGRLWVGWAGQWMTVALSAVLLMAWPESRDSLARYVNQQVLASLAGTREVSAGSFAVLKALAEGVWLPLLAMVLLAAVAARGFVRAPRYGDALGWAALGLSGSLPIMISSKQTGHYLVPAVPFYAMAVALAVLPMVTKLTANQGARRRLALLGAAGLVMCAAVGAMFLPALARDRALITELDTIASSVPRETTIGICPDAMGEWGLHAWFERRFMASLGVQEQPGWFLKTASARADCPPTYCRPVTDPARDLVLMKCIR